MSQAERIKEELGKEELGWFKVVFAVLAAIDASLVAWLAQNFAVATGALLIAGLILVAVLTGAIIWTNRVVYRRLEQLEKL